MDGNEGKRSGRELAVEALIDTHPNGPAYRVKKTKVRNSQVNSIEDNLIFSSILLVDLSLTACL